MSYGAGGTQELNRAQLPAQRSAPGPAAGSSAGSAAGSSAGSPAEPTPLARAVAARVRATCRLRDAEHWRRLVEARLDLAVAAVADIDDLHTLGELGGDLDDVEATLAELRALLGMPDCADGDGRLAESSLLIRLRTALDELDRYILAVRDELDQATAGVAAWIVEDEPALD